MTSPVVTAAIFPSGCPDPNPVPLGRPGDLFLSVCGSVRFTLSCSLDGSPAPAGIGATWQKLNALWQVEAGEWDLSTLPDLIVSIYEWYIPSYNQSQHIPTSYFPIWGLPPFRLDVQYRSELGGLGATACFAFVAFWFEYSYDQFNWDGNLMVECLLSSLGQRNRQTCRCWLLHGKISLNFGNEPFNPNLSRPHFWFVYMTCAW